MIKINRTQKNAKTEISPKKQALDSIEEINELDWHQKRKVQ